MLHGGSQPFAWASLAFLAANLEDGMVSEQSSVHLAQMCIWHKCWTGVLHVTSCAEVAATKSARGWEVH